MNDINILKKKMSDKKDRIEDLYEWLNKFCVLEYFSDGFLKDSDMNKEIFISDPKTGGHFRVQIKDIPKRFL